ncbi:Esterase/lipase superfamily enzyme [Sulfidibacter corallicola]|uniref:Esterase/lipase superfamily enzyme n=1 Tax=Sulfidibacter corallicola TaxID=2818388 RepID=A0A8A4TEV9_SULCO|nr:alpha/beta hydrolase-fold protein [Sulfidibacter corallicola]QTD48077.1 hypothetical protein J3U87_21035 [Sulfidibacter corallicola]
MKKRHEMIESPHMGRKVHLWSYGHWGMPVLVFPSAAGFAHEWDSHGMVDALSWYIDSGKIKLYCPESNVSQSWTNKNGDMAERIHQHKIYEAFILNTLVPWIRFDCQTANIPITTTGTSLGGFYAAVFALKFPEIFRSAVCMSGRYDLTEFTGGFTNGDIYFNNPLAFVPNLEGDALERVRTHTMINLVCGRGAWEEGCIEETIYLGRWLHHKQIPNYIDIWGPESSHEWPWWREQARKHFGRIFG